MKVSELLSQVSTLLVDTSNTRWANAELLDYYNDGGKIIVSFKPQANATTSAVLMGADTKQSLPTGGTSLICATRNMGTDGSTPGAGVTIVDKYILNRVYPNWNTDTASATVVHYMYDKREPEIFYIYPKGSGTGYLEITYGKAPTEVAIGDIATTDIEITDDYINVLLDYIMYRALSKDADTPNSQAKAKGYEDSYRTALDLEIRGDAMSDPNMTKGGY